MHSNGLNILVDPKEAARNKRGPAATDDALVAWIMERVNQWEQHRNSNYFKRWDEYYRIWRTEWHSDDRERQVERSRIVPTTLAEQVEKAAAELSDAFFGRANWFDVADNIGDQNRADVAAMAGRLREDLTAWGAPAELDKAFLYGAVYGTSIVKLVVETAEQAEPVQIVNEMGERVLGGAAIRQNVVVRPVAISPREFVIDPSAKTVQQALGCAHITNVPSHTIHAQQRNGVYVKGDVGGWSPSGAEAWKTEMLHDHVGMARLVEYHGLVPKALMPGSKPKEDTRRKIVENALDDSVELVEAIVLIANDSFRLKAVESPFTLKDRSIVASQFETVPDSFWGRGIIEKGYHPHKALQTEFRARSDGLALANYPMIWRDAASVSSDETLEQPGMRDIEPGKEYKINGNPNDSIREFKFSGPDPQSSRVITEYERMIESATGSMGFQAALLSSKDTSAGGAPLALQSFVRRSKRVAYNLERQLIGPVVHKSAWRMMQFRPDRYPPVDFSFSIKGALGILQRDVERASLLELLSAIPPESPAFYGIIRVLVEEGAYSDKAELLAIVDGLIAAALNPPPPPPDLSGQARMLSAQQRAQEHADEMILEQERLRRQDLELLIKAKGTQNGDSGGNGRGGADNDTVNVNVNTGRKRVRIVRTNEGLEGITEDID